jgi:predicted ATPase
VPELPRGTVTLLFTDIEGSTRLLLELGDRYAELLAEHRRVLREAFARHGGVEVDTQGDAFFVAFTRANDAAAAAADAQRALTDGPMRVRMGIHTGEPIVTDDGYIGVDVHQTARIAAAAHGGQVLFSGTTRQLLAPALELRDLGEHRLRDLGPPQRLYQLGNDKFPPLRSLYQTNLPVQPTPLVGRERELEEVRRLLESCRLLTLTGPGGCGKTRVALQLAADVAEAFADGLFWVPLQTLTSPGLVAPTISQAVGAKADLTDYLRGKRLLLLIDNFEQLLDDRYALADLLAECPELKLLVTSREPLHLAGEQEYEVPPLPEADAVVLFVERARSVKANFEPDEHIFEICRRLDGLPLAIELAAARTKILPTSAIVERLDQRLEFLTRAARDAPARHRTLRATLEWSHELLRDAEKQAFARLSVFAGGCTIAAADEICATGIETMHSLVDKSLVRALGERFAMFETIQQYALERLEDSGDGDAIRRRHAEYFAALAVQAEQALETGDAAVWLDRLSEETANLRAALAWSANTDRDLHAALATSLRNFWLARGDVTEGQAWLDGVLVRVPESTLLRAKALEGAMELARVVGDHRRAKNLAEERLALARELDAPDVRASALHDVGLLAADEGEHERAQAFYEEAVELGRRIGHRRVALWLTDLGSLARWHSDFERAAAILQEALGLHRQARDAAGVAYALDELATVVLHEGRPDEARTLLTEGLRNWQTVGATNLIVVSLDTHAAAIAAQGEGERAARLLGAARALRESMAIRPLYQEKNASPANLAAATARAQVGDDAFEAAFAHGQMLSLDDAIAEALADVSGKPTLTATPTGRAPSG